MTYANHPYVRERRKAMPDVPFAVIDGLAVDNWLASNPGATPAETRAAMLAPEHVLWSSDPIDDFIEIVSIVQVEEEDGDGRPIHVIELRRGGLGQESATAAEGE